MFIGVSFYPVTLKADHPGWPRQRLHTTEDQVNGLHLIAELFAL